MKAQPSIKSIVACPAGGSVKLTDGLCASIKRMMERLVVVVVVVLNVVYVIGKKVVHFIMSTVMVA